MTSRAFPFAFFAALLLLLLLAPAAVHAQDGATEEDPEPEVSTQADQWDRVLAVSVLGGWDTPLGVAGAQIEVTPWRHLMIYGGAGVSRSGVRVGGGVQLRFPVGEGAFGLDGGVTGGPLDWDSRNDEGQLRNHRWWEFAMFIHGGAFFEYRWPMGLFGRFNVGADALVTPDEATECTDATGAECASIGFFKPVRGFMQLTIGYAFDL